MSFTKRVILVVLTVYILPLAKDYTTAKLIKTSTYEVQHTGGKATGAPAKR